MFVSVACDFGNDDHELAVEDMLLQYGFRRVMKHVYESAKIKEATLLRLKRDIDRITDSFDKIRFYQYPLDDTFTISFLANKQWRKTVVRK
jgi:CRISPR-associated protein Cas2